METFLLLSTMYAIYIYVSLFIFNIFFDRHNSQPLGCSTFGRHASMKFACLLKTFKKLEMKVKSIFATAAVVFYVGANAQSMSKSNYPKAIKGSQTDNYFGTSVVDPFRDLENDSDATKKWVDEEVAYSQNYLSKIPFRDQIKEQLRTIWNYEKISAPFKEGDYTYFSKNNGLQAQSVIYRTGLKTKNIEVFLDPNKGAGLVLKTPRLHNSQSIGNLWKRSPHEAGRAPPR